MATESQIHENWGESVMKNFFVTVVDILGIFVPGFLLLVGVALFPTVRLVLK